MGVRIDDVTYAETLSILRAAIANRVPHTVSTPNPEIVMLARSDPGFKAVLERMDLNIPDGVGLLLAARLQGSRLREHVQGTDVVLKLAAESPNAGYRWFFLGGHGNVAERAGRALQQSFPGLEVAGVMGGSPLAADDERTRASIRAAGRVDVLLVAFGAGKQEPWLDRNLADLGIPVGIGVGGVFNYLSGDAPRAPAWLRQIHFEWLHRLVTQPWRWRRQLALPQFAGLVLWQTVRAKARYARSQRYRTK